MNEWLLLIAISTAGALVSLIGGVFLLYSKTFGRLLQWVAIPLAAGALLAAAFFDLMPHTLEHEESGLVLRLTLAGFLVFFMLERSLGWFHHHHHHKRNQRPHKNHQRHHHNSLIIIGDSLHNFIDGLAIGAAFLVSPATGVVTAVAVAMHEIPQEVGDFGLLLKRGMKRRNVLLVNVVSALLTVLGASIVFAAGDILGDAQSLVLAFTAGCFLYIAASDIIPTIHSEPSRRVATMQSLVMLVSVVVVAVLIDWTHGFIPHHH